MEKKNTGLIVLVAILSILVVGLGGFIIYDKVLKDKNQVNDNTENNEKFNNKIVNNFTYDVVTKEIHKSLIGKYVDEATNNTFTEIKENGEIILSIEACESVSTYTNSDVEINIMYSE